MPTIQLPFEAILEATETLSRAERDTLARHLEGVEENQERTWTRRIRPLAKVRRMNSQSEKGVNLR